ncbi:MAG TPA: hypothetical protein PKL57_02115 [Candidatus Wallbacteria bacterium]|nr:hypothetical protein [Candidatus Wallbacteria bacterium]
MAQLFVPVCLYAAPGGAADSEETAIAGEAALSTAENSISAASESAGETESVSASADSSEVSSAAGSQLPGETAVTKDIVTLLSNNKTIFFLEQMAALKMSNDNTEVEKVLNSLYNEREAVSARLAAACAGDGSNKTIKIIKRHVLNTRLYELYGMDSFILYALNLPAVQNGEGNTDSVEISGNFLKDSLLELKSYIKLENSRLENSPGFISDLDGYMSSFDIKKIASVSTSNCQDGGFSKEESNVLLSPDKISPGANSTDAPISGPITIKFNAAKINGAALAEVDVKSIKVNQKYSKSNPRDAGAIKFTWAAAEALLTIVCSSPLERNALYGVSVALDHKIIPPAKKEGPAVSEKGFFRSRSVNSGLFKTVDINLTDRLVSYRLDWNFRTLAYESTSSETALSSEAPPATDETELGDKSTAETELKDKRDTEEAEVGDKAANSNKTGTSESSLNKKDLMTGELFDQPKNMPALVERYPEGVSIRPGSEIYIVFSCDIDPKSVNNDTMQLFCESGERSVFERLPYKLSLEGRKLTLTPQKPLYASKNYKIAVTKIRTAKKLDMPINETFFFKTACAVMSAKLACDGKVKKDETFEVTISEDVADLGINFFEIEKKKEKPLEFDICGKVFRQPEARRTIDVMALGANVKSKSAQVKEKAAKEKIIKPQGPLTVLIKPKKPLIKGREYKIDVFSPGGIIENGIIKFTAR